MLGLIKSGFTAAARQPWLELCKRRRRLVRPLFLDYAVTWRCNARCVMCDTWRQGTTPPTGEAAELSVDELGRILKRDRAFLSALRKVGLTGGEPFLREDLTDIIALLHRALPRARISVVSNGLLTQRILKALERVRAFFPELIFSVSLDGLGPVHDTVRGIPGAYDKALATIKGARELGFTVTSGMTLSARNFDQIQPVSGLLAGLGVDFSCNLQERGANFHNDGQADALDEDMRRRVLSDLEPFAHHFYMDHVRKQIEGRRRTLPCYSGLTSYFLKPNGDVAVCNLLGEPLGNLRQTPFAAIAGDVKSWQRRESLAGCTCWSQCEVKNSAAVAPWHVLAWWAGSGSKAGFLRHYAKKAGVLPR